MLKCPICNKEFSQLTHTHLSNDHDMSIREFKSIYPNFRLRSPESSNKQSIINRSTRFRNISNYNKNPKKCKTCDNDIPYDKKRQDYCSRICGNQHRNHTDETKAKIKNTINDRIKKYGPYPQSRTFVTRSKNEIALFGLLSNTFECIANEKIFNGRDADIIIPDLKLAILWNGIWHYEPVIKNRSLLQSFNRDIYKLKQIKKCNYHYIIIKDHNNKMSPIKAYNRILECIKNEDWDLEIIK